MILIQELCSQRIGIFILHHIIWYWTEVESPSPNHCRVLLSYYSMVIADKHGWLLERLYENSCCTGMTGVILWYQHEIHGMIKNLLNVIHSIGWDNCSGVPRLIFGVVDGVVAPHRILIATEMGSAAQVIHSIGGFVKSDPEIVFWLWCTRFCSWLHH